MSRLEVACRHRYPSGFTLDADFVAEGGITAIVGPSGSGKTTLLSLVAGLMRPSEGRIRLGGQVLFDSEARVNLPPEKRRIGYVFQDYLLFPHLTVRGNLLYGRKRRPAGAEGPDPEAVVAELELGELLGRRPASLSGGQRQRVALGRALLAGPRLLLLDEPLASLDARLKGKILDSFARGLRLWPVPVVFVTHHPEEVRPLAARVLTMEEGRVVGREEAKP